MIFAIMSFQSLLPNQKAFCRKGLNMTLIDKALSDLHRIEKEINTCRNILTSNPCGSLICRKNGRYNKWFRKTRNLDGSCRLAYLPKRNRALAKELAVNSFYEKKLSLLDHEAAAIRSYIKKHDRSADGCSVLSQLSPGIQELLSETPLLSNGHSDSIASETLTAWQNAPFKSNPFHPESVVVPVNAHLKVRSKSEAFIASALIDNAIPFRYESPVILGATTYYPDFSIRHPDTGAFFYWEHFGLMDRTDYINHSISKLRIFCENGLIPMVNLIITSETAAAPLDMSLVMALIDHYFLS